MENEMIPVTSVSLLKVLGSDAQSPRWTEFARKYASTIDGFLYRYFPSVDAEEVVNETLIALVEKLPLYEYDPTYAAEGGVVYLKDRGFMIRCLSGREIITMPAGIKEVNARAFQFASSVRKVACNGPLPVVYEPGCKGFMGKIAQSCERFWYWCKGPSSYRWDRIFSPFKKRARNPLLANASADCITYVRRGGADDRTCAIVQTGCWEGRPVKWLQE